MTTIRLMACPARPAALTAALAATLTAGLAACGTQGSATGASTHATTSASASPSDPLASLTATAIINKAIGDTTAASTVHFIGTSTNAGQKITFALTVVRGKGCTGTITEGKSGSFQVVYLGKNVWVKPDDTFWKTAAGSDSGDSATLSLLSGKWLLGSASDTAAGSLVSICSLNTLLTQAAPATDRVVKGARTTLNGQPILPITDITQNGTVEVTDVARPELLSMTATGANGGTMTFADYGAPATITPPPSGKVINGSQYGF